MRLFTVCLAVATLVSGCASAASAPPAAQPKPKNAAVAARPAEGVPLVLRLPRPKGGEWLGLYILDKKAGWAFSDVREATYEGQKAILVTSLVALNVTVGSVPTRREVREEHYFEYKDGGRLLAFRAEKTGDGGNEILIGRCSPEGVDLVRKRPEMPDETRRLPPTAELLEHADAARVVSHTRQKIEGYTLDLDETLQDKKIVTEWVGEKTEIVAGVEVPVLQTRTTEVKGNITVDTKIAKAGRTLEIRFAGVMVGRAEDEKIAKSVDKVELFNLTRVVLDRPLPEARDRLESISYSVEGIPEAARRESARQQFSESGKKLVIRALGPSRALERPVAAEGEDVVEGLKSNLVVEADAPAIVAAAKKVVGDEKDVWKAAEKINRFVYGTLDKSYGSSSDRATDVLAAKRGDCTEHSLLFTALARASGIPARRVDGLVYMVAGDGVPALYWHEWVEVFVGEWVAMDPTFGQIIADPTHLALGYEGRGETAGLIGQLTIKVTDVKQRPAE